jgi:hypothetical protein
MITGKYLFFFGFASLRVFFFDNLGIVFYDVGEFIFFEDFIPKIICGKSICIGRISRSVIIALIERQKP